MSVVECLLVLAVCDLFDLPWNWWAPIYVGASVVGYLCERSDNQHNGA